jgi:hypothetical protein
MILAIMCMLVGFLLAAVTPGDRKCSLPDPRRLIENPDILHTAFSMFVIVSCFIMVVIHSASWPNVSPVISLVIGHLFGKASCK